MKIQSTVGGILFGCLVVSTWTAVAQESRPKVEIRFAGSRQLLAMEEAGSFTNLVAEPATGRFLQQSKSLLSNYLPVRLLGDRFPQAKALSRIVYALSDDAVTQGFLLRLNGDHGTDHGWLLAVRIDAERHSAWKENLIEAGRILKFNQLVSIPVSVGEAWRLADAEGTSGFSFLMTDNWCLVSDDVSGKPEWDAVQTGGDLLEDLGDRWLTVSADLSALTREHGWLTGLAPAYAKGGFTFQKGTIRNEWTVSLAKDYTVRDGAWTLPLNTLRDPLISFTAARGVHSMLGAMDWFRQLQLSKVPDQIFYWARSDIPFKTEGALKVEDVATAVDRLEETIPNLANPHLITRAIGEFQVTTNAPGVVWKGLPLLVPFVRAAQEDSGDFVYFGLFPTVDNPDRNPPPPDALLDQVRGRDDLVYYDWEITQLRLEQYERIRPYFGLVVKMPGNPEGFGARFIQGISKYLGNTITEAVLKDPRTVHVVRRSNLGLTAWELNWLARMLDVTPFPSAPYRWPDPIDRSGPPAAGDNTLEPPPQRR